MRRKGRLGWREVDARDVYLQRDRGDGSETLGVFGAGQMVWSTSYVGRSMMSPPLFWYWKAVFGGSAGCEHGNEESDHGAGCFLLSRIATIVPADPESRSAAMNAVAWYGRGLWRPDRAWRWRWKQAGGRER